MTENFKTSEFDALFGATSVKTPFSGGSYREINENLERAVKANPSIRYIIRGLDYGSLAVEKDVMRSDAILPTYLYDNKIFNDTQYILNKEVLFDATLYALAYSHSGQKTTSFDEYANWMKVYSFGKEAVAATYTRPDKEENQIEITEEDYRLLEENLEQNVISLAKENPQIQFYLFFTPYSIYSWDSLMQRGLLEKQLKLEKRAIELLTDYKNIYLFSFFDEFSMICDLNNYKDVIHYGENVNSQMLSWMKKGEHRLTRENYQKYWDKVYKFYTTYDYDALFKS